MQKTKHRIKVYTVQIDFTDIKTNRWYYHRKGEFYNCVLISKTCDSGHIIPCYCVLGRDETTMYSIPTLYRTIRCEDCSVVHETVLAGTESLRNFIENFTILENGNSNIRARA